MGSFFRMRFHVTGEQVALRRRVIAVVAHVSLRHRLRRADLLDLGLVILEISTDVIVVAELVLAVEVVDAHVISILFVLVVIVWLLNDENVADLTGVTVRGNNGNSLVLIATRVQDNLVVIDTAATILSSSSTTSTPTWFI